MNPCTILVPLVGSAQDGCVVSYAAALAHTTAGRVLLVQPSTGAGQVDVSFAQCASTRRRAAAEHVPTEYLAVNGDPLTAILRAVHAEQANLVVMAEHQVSAVHHHLSADLAAQVVAHLPVPVLFLSAACERTWPTTRPPRVLVPLDGSTEAEAVLTWLQHHIGVHAALDVLLLQVIEEPSADAHSSVMRYLERLTDALRERGTNATWEVASGAVADTVAELGLARAVDLIAMTTHGRGGEPRLQLGSISSADLEWGPTPLLLFPPASVARRASPGPSPRGASGVLAGARV